LQPGEERSVGFELARRDVSYWDTELQDWVVLSGDFTFHVGFSSREILASSVSSLK
jgi:beta-glucosidase